MTSLQTGTGTLSITGAAARIITFAAGAHLINVNLNAANVTIQSSGSGTLNWQALTLQSGTINQGSVDFAFLSNINSYTQSGGTFNGSSNAVTFNSEFTQSGGTFNGGSGNLDVKKTFSLTGGSFNSTTGTLFLGASFFDDVGGIFNHNGGTVTFDGNGGNIESQGNTYYNGGNPVGASNVLAMTRPAACSSGTVSLAPRGIAAQSFSTAASKDKRSDIEMIKAVRSGDRYHGTLARNRAAVLTLA